MTDGGRVVPLRPRTDHTSGTVIIRSDSLFLLSGKLQYGPQWGFNAEMEIDGEPQRFPLHAGIVGEIDDEPESLGWLDREADSYSGKFVVGQGWEDLIRQAAFSATPWEIEVAFLLDADGDIVRLSIGMRREPKGR